MRAKEFITCTESKKINKNIIVPSWSLLDEGLSLSDKISIFEEFHINGNLTESSDEDKRAYFTKLFKMSDIPQLGKKFIVAPLSLIGNRILLLDKPSYMEYVGKDDGQLVFKHGDKEIRYPSKTMKDLSLSYTFTFLNGDTYNKFKTALSLKFDTILPKAEVTEERLDEVPLPPDWDPEKLNLRQTYKDRLQYALDRAKRLGGGSSRVAMTIDYQGRPTVLKVAKNAKGLAQNEAEVEILLDGYAGNLPIVIPLIDYDKANKRPVWLQTELAKKVRSDTLAKLLHTPALWFLIDFVNILAGKASPNNFILNRRTTTVEGMKELYFNPDMWKFNKQKPTDQGWEIFNTYASELNDLVNSTIIELNDLNNPSNWGIYNNRPVVIDLGFTEDTAQLYMR